MEQIPGWLQTIIDKVEDVTFDRAHFSAFGDFSKNIELVYFVESKDYYTYMDRLQEINLEVHKKFDKEKIEFAFPSQTIYVQK
jgi:small-conductance mechanosensitive channel